MIENVIVKVIDLPESIKSNLKTVNLRDVTRGISFEIEYIPNNKILSSFDIIREDDLHLQNEQDYLMFFNEIYLLLCKQLETNNLKLTCVLQVSQGLLVFGDLNTNKITNKNILKG